MALPTRTNRVPGVERGAQQPVNQGTLPLVKTQFTPGQDDIPVHYLNSGQKNPGQKNSGQKNPDQLHGGSNIEDHGASGGVQSYWNPRESTVMSYITAVNFVGEAAVYLGGIYQGKVNVTSGVLTVVKIRLKTLGGTCGGVEVMKVVLVDQEGWQLEVDGATAVNKFKTVCITEAEETRALTGNDPRGGTYHGEGGTSEMVNSVGDEERRNVFKRIYENNEWQVRLVCMCIT